MTPNTHIAFPLPSLFLIERLEQAKTHITEYKQSFSGKCGFFCWVVRVCKYLLTRKTYQGKHSYHGGKANHTSHRSVSNLLNPFTPKSAKFKTERKISFCKIVKNKQHHLKILLNSVHLNGHTLGFHPQTQKLQGVKGLTDN